MLVVGLALSGALFAAQVLLLHSAGPWCELLLLPMLWLLGRREKISVKQDAPGLLIAAGILLGAIVAALFVEHSIRYPDGGWDARAIWNLRARAIFAAPFDRAAIFAPEAPHADYPPLLPALIAQGWFLLGARTQLWPILVSALFAIGGAHALFAGVSRKAGTGAAWMSVLLLIGAPQFLLLTWQQTADLKVAMLLLVAVIAAREEQFVLCGVACGLAALTKNEAVFEAGILLALVRKPRAWLAAAPALVAFLAFHFAVPANDLQSALHWPHALPLRLWQVLRAFAAQLWSFSDWGLSLPALVLFALWKRPRLEFLGLSLLFLFGVYLFTPLPLEYHLSSSLDRLLFQLFPSALYACAASFPDKESGLLIRGNCAPSSTLAR
jgi:hypothetical protein